MVFSVSVYPACACLVRRCDAFCLYGPSRNHIPGLALAPEARSFDSPSASIDFEITSGEGELTYRFEFVLKDHIVPAEHYEGFKKAIDMMHEIADAWVLCTAP